MLLGDEALARLQAARVALFGLGGVGGHAAEALVRGGVGRLVLVDGDRVCLSNLNRQFCATHATLGQLKVEALRMRLLQINPHLEVEVHPCFLTETNVALFELARCDYVIDAVDDIAAKVLLARECHRLNVPLIASMGAGNKLDPTRFEVADIYATTVCPLAKRMRRELRALGIPALPVVYSREEPIKPRPAVMECAVLPPSDAALESVDRCRQGCRRSRLPSGAHAPGSVSFVPPVAGLILAGEVIKRLGGISQPPRQPPCRPPESW